MGATVNLMSLLLICLMNSVHSEEISTYETTENSYETTENLYETTEGTYETTEGTYEATEGTIEPYETTQETYSSYETSEDMMEETTPKGFLFIYLILFFEIYFI